MWLSLLCRIRGWSFTQNNIWKLVWKIMLTKAPVTPCDTLLPHTNAGEKWSNSNSRHIDGIIAIFLPGQRLATQTGFLCRVHHVLNRPEAEQRRPRWKMGWCGPAGFKLDEMLFWKCYVLQDTLWLWIVNSALYHDYRTWYKVSSINFLFGGKDGHFSMNCDIIDQPGKPWRQKLQWCQRPV